MAVINILCEDIIEQYSDLIYRIALIKSKNKQDAEDIFQEVFISLMKNLKNIQDEKHLKHWLIRATINRAKNLHISFWKKQVDLYDAPIDENVSKEDENEAIDKVREQINSLPKKLQAVVYLYYYEEYPVDEISMILKVPNGTVKSRLHTARKLLRNSLGEGIINAIQ